MYVYIKKLVASFLLIMSVSLFGAASSSVAQAPVQDAAAMRTASLKAKSEGIHNFVKNYISWQLSEKFEKIEPILLRYLENDDICMSGRRRPDKNDVEYLGKDLFGRLRASGFTRLRRDDFQFLRDETSLMSRASATDAPSTMDRWNEIINELDGILKSPYTSQDRLVVAGMMHSFCLTLKCELLYRIARMWYHAPAKKRSAYNARINLGPIDRDSIIGSTLQTDLWDLETKIQAECGDKCFRRGAPGFDSQMRAEVAISRLAATNQRIDSLMKITANPGYESPLQIKAGMEVEVTGFEVSKSRPAIESQVLRRSRDIGSSTEFDEGDSVCQSPSGSISQLQAEDTAGVYGGLGRFRRSPQVVGGPQNDITAFSASIRPAAPPLAPEESALFLKALQDDGAI